MPNSFQCLAKINAIQDALPRQPVAGALLLRLLFSWFGLMRQAVPFDRVLLPPSVSGGMRIVRIVKDRRIAPAWQVSGPAMSVEADFVDSDESIDSAEW